MYGEEKNCVSGVLFDFCFASTVRVLMCGRIVADLRPCDAAATTRSSRFLVAELNFDCFCDY
jgi:hypothetical protein